MVWLQSLVTFTGLERWSQMLTTIERLVRSSLPYLQNSNPANFLYRSKLLMHSPKIHLGGTCKIISGQKTQKLRFKVMLYMHE